MLPLLSSSALLRDPGLSADPLCFTIGCALGLNPSPPTLSSDRASPFQHHSLHVVTVTLVTHICTKLKFHLQGKLPENHLRSVLTGPSKTLRGCCAQRWQPARHPMVLLNDFFFLPGAWGIGAGGKRAWPGRRMFSWLARGVIFGSWPLTQFTKTFHCQEPLSKGVVSDEAGLGWAVF